MRVSLDPLHPLRSQRQNSPFTPVKPWPIPRKEDCVFYHAITLPNGEELLGGADIRKHFDSYIGQYPVADKTFLDVGTASGTLSFSAEKAGAIVTSLETSDARDMKRIPSKGLVYHEDRAAYLAGIEEDLHKLKSGYWYAWHKLGSKAEVVYAPFEDLPFWDRQFDVVVLGAIIEHCPDPVTMIGDLARIAKEAVIIAFTEVSWSDDLQMRAPDNWLKDDAAHSFTWWILSSRLYTRLFDKLGFSVEFVEATTLYPGWGPGEYKRPTIIARRK